MRNTAKYLLKQRIATGAGEELAAYGDSRVIQVEGATSAGAGAATVKIQVRASQDAEWLDLATFTMTLSTTKVSEGFVSEAPWPLIRANVTAISGTDATLDAWVAGEA